MMFDEKKMAFDARAAGESLFRPASWQAKINFINHLVLFNNALIAVLSEKGGGKSSFISLLLPGLDNAIKPVHITITAPFEKEAFLINLAETLHLKTTLRTNLSSLVDQINERKSQVLVIVDNAELLPELFIEEILNTLKSQGQGAYFHMALFSDFSILGVLNRLDRNEFGQLIHTIEPGSLSESETRSYLMQKLGHQKRLDKILSEKNLEQFYHLTGGNIARMNAHMTDFFLAQEAIAPLKTQKLKSILAWAAAAIFGVVAILFALQVHSPAQTTQVVALQKDKNASDRVHSHVAFYRENGQRVFLAQTPPLLSLSKTVDLTRNADTDLPSSLVVTDKVLVAPKVIKKTTKPVQAANRQEIMTPHDIPKSSLPSIRASKPIAQVQARKADVKNTRFTIQLLASAHKEDVLRFQRNHQLGRKTQVRALQHYGSVWFALTYGEYRSMQEAQQAVGHLPKALSYFRPWVRTVAAYA